jgi:glutamate synthase (NADPH/NADH) small chain
LDGLLVKNTNKGELEEMAGTEEVIACDMAFLAIGFSNPEHSLPNQFGLELDPRGNIKTTGFQASKTGQTTPSGQTSGHNESMIFAAGAKA